MFGNPASSVPTGPGMLYSNCTRPMAERFIAPVGRPANGYGAIQMQVIIDFLVEEPLLLLFIVAGLGYLLGHVKVRGISLLSLIHI